ncbi:MAG: histidine kinase [Flavobacterium sp. JAD_PAG50586_2]|nr:MAG: histidine kinase [Flavobacterium sp. JAD_PAG50586_2]
MSKEEIISGIIISIAFISLIVLFCILLVQLYIKKIKDYTAKELAFQKTLNETIIETQEQVLKNISQDLHDDIGQQLTSINFQLENLKLDSPDFEKSLEPVSKSLRQLSQSIRSISHSLSKDVIEQNNLIRTIESDIKRLKRNRKMAISFVFEELGRKTFTANERIFIYRIFQECIGNCLKHSKCNKMNILIRTKPEFEMIFSDNGVGFDPEADCGGKPSMGLNNMKTRANDINYSLVIKSAAGEGTNIILCEAKPD